MANTLEYFDCTNNSLICLNDLPSGLKYLFCSNNQITQLINLPNLIEYNWNFNPITMIVYPLDIELTTFPNTLTNLSFTNDNYSFDLDNLPPNLTFLKISKSTHPIDCNILPKSLKIIEISQNINSSFNITNTFDIIIMMNINEFQNKNISIPDVVKIIQIHPSYSYEPYNNIYFENINPNIEIVLEWNRSIPLTNLPAQLTVLIFNKIFNQPIDNLSLISTDTLKKLLFNDYSSFNQPLDNLPPWITHLIFNKYSYFSQPLTNLPNKLTHLSLGNNFSHSLDYLPESLTFLSLDITYCQSINNLPSGLTHLTIGKYNYIPDYDKIDNINNIDNKIIRLIY